eukprot:CAMPEP_0195586772 /NCGR_PEP_ID=MMETSP0814-20130614/29875_1 /TAXON_ID=97485 /ORGANISM="Prymnesium parvum, Strain Texoma1" /LENGTH=117 /DNA_ID=CAMNT_0040725379 /DNA_START=105 /DNA_END=454 /DNA_ORIENTATION=-
MLVDHMQTRAARSSRAKRCPKARRDAMCALSPLNSQRPLPPPHSAASLNTLSPSMLLAFSSVSPSAPSSAPSKSASTSSSSAASPLSLALVISPSPISLCPSPISLSPSPISLSPSP